VQYDPIKKMLSCHGALPAGIAQKLQSLSTDPAFHRAIDQLFLESHQQPITDRLAYNPQRSLQEKRVRDVMVELEMQPESMQSQFWIRMHDGQYAFICQLDLASRTGELRIEGSDNVLRTGTLPELPFEQPIKVEMSLFDRQVLVAVNDQLIFEPYAFRASDKPVEPIRNPVAVAASGAPLHLLRQRVYRDVYYRPLPRDQEPEAAPVEYRLGPEEYFVLGDNSSVSVDSRHWPAGSVTQGLLIGRPVILHLPSQKKEVTIGSYTTRIRVPDLERIRLLR